MITNPTIGMYGQLGNQLFQYAFLYGQCLRLRRRAFINANNPGFDLHPYHITAAGTISVVSANRYRDRFEREIVADWPERSFLNSDELAWGPDSCAYSGYFQSPNYFIDCADAVRRIVQPRTDLPASAAHWERLIERSSQPVVGIHVRLGDYLTIPTIFTNLQTTHYYERALSFFRLVLPGGFLPLIFSDDIGWCETSGLFTELEAAHFVEGLDKFSDLRLLSLCDHHVVANSSFSWWGAWLASHESQVVLAPKQWFGPAGFPDWGTIYPAGWTIL